MGREFRVNMRDADFDIVQYLNELTSSYYADKVMDFIKENVKEGSLGLKLINIMCTQLEAVHEIKSDKGVTHKIKFSFVKP